MASGGTLGRMALFATAGRADGPVLFEAEARLGVTTGAAAEGCTKLAAGVEDRGVFDF
jgi:hypothetical protein